MSKLPMGLLKLWSIISVAKFNESLIVFLLIISGSKNVCQVEKVGHKYEQLSAHLLCTLQ